jgi:hypothetical protein
MALFARRLGRWLNLQVGHVVSLRQTLESSFEDGFLGIIQRGIEQTDLEEKEFIRHLKQYWDWNPPADLTSQAEDDLKLLENYSEEPASTVVANSTSVSRGPYLHNFSHWCKNNARYIFEALNESARILTEFESQVTLFDDSATKLNASDGTESVFEQ